MKTATTRSELRQARAELPHPVGFVPTMGFLHPGHLSLVRMAREQCASAVVSIFVNPTQFNAPEDLESYPRDAERDLRMLEAEGVDLVWLPTPEIIYPAGFQTWINVEEVSRPLEGAHRPGHFRGVATVVAKLFHAVQPARAYFGQKDAQQVRVIQRMVQDLDFPIAIEVGATVREPDGLAMSSRNHHLSPEERQAAAVLSRALALARTAYRTGTDRAEELRAVLQDVLRGEPRATVDYVSCADPETLEELEGPVEHGLLSLAVTVGRTRLIDNEILRRCS
ncbi:MAG: pantoate--beta-alanine ligase [Armatimonadetes bacterium]|nr:pantoate--beta-alanine ligase [Armatimonadota bacterium]